MLNGADLQLEELLLQQPRDLDFGLLHGQLLGALNSQVQFPLPIRGCFARSITGAYGENIISLKVLMILSIPLT